MSPHALIVACLLLGAHAAPRAPRAPPALDDIELDAVEAGDPLPAAAPLAPAAAPDADELQRKRLDENSNDYIPDPDSEAGQRKVPLDLSNPGPPQRQEHETQNQSPGHYGTQERALVLIREQLDRARATFDEQIKTVSSSFEALVRGSDNLPAIHDQVRHLRTSFSAQLDDLNNTIRSYVRPCGQDLKAGLRPDDEPADLEADLKEVQHNFDNGIGMISEGLEMITILKEEDEAALRAQAKDDAGTTSTTTLAPETATQTMNFFQSAFSSFSNLVSNSITNLQNRLTNLTGQAVPQPAPAAAVPGVPVAPVAPTTQRPILQGLTNVLPNFFNRPQSPAILQPQANQPSNAVGSQPANPPQQQALPPQAQPTAQPQPAAATQPGPIAQFIQTNPIIQRVTSFLRPQPTAQPVQQPAQQQAQAQAQPPQPQAQPQAELAQTAAQPQPQAAQPQAAQPQAAQPQAAQPAQPQPGPIQQIVQNNPIIRGFQAAVQRVQNPVNPQDPSKPRDNEVEKGHGGYGGYNGQVNQGDNNVDSGVAGPADEVKSLGPDAVTQEVREPEIKETPSDETTEA